MPTASTVTIRLDGDSARLVKELNKASRKTKSFGADVKKAVGAAAKVFATFGAGAVLALGALVKKMLAVSDALGKTADKIGLTTEQLAGLQLQAEITGTTSLVLEKAFKNMSKVIVDVSRGAGVAKISFDQMGISADDLLKKTAFEQFTTLAEKMKFLGTRTEQLAFAYEVFGGRATDLLLLLDGGKETMDAWIKRAKDLGLAMSRFDIAQLEAANDAMLEMKSAIAGLGNRIARSVSPLITVFGERFVQFVIDFTKAAKEGENGLNTLKTVSATVVAGLINGVNLVSGAWLGAKLAILSAVLVLEELKGSAKDVTEPMAKDVAFIEEQIRRLSRTLVFDPRGGLIGDQEETLQSLRGLQVELETIRDLQANLIAEGFVGEDPLAPLRESIKETTDKIADLTVRTAEDVAKAVAKAYAEGLVAVPDTPPSGLVDPNNPKGIVKSNLEAAGDVVRAWEFANQQRLEMDAALKASLEESELQAQVRLTELAIAQAQERVRLELEAKNIALDEAGVPVTEEARLAAEVQVQEEALKALKSFLDRRAKLIITNAKAVAKVDAEAAKVKKLTAANVQNFLTTVLQAGATKSKILGKAAFLFNKFLAAKEAFVQTQVAYTKTLASLPYPANIVAAASVAALGGAAVAAISASAFSGGPSAGSAAISSPGAFGAPSDFGAPGDIDAPGEAGAPDRSFSTIEIIFQGPILADDAATKQFITDTIADAVNDHDLVVIERSSRQADEIRNG